MGTVTVVLDADAYSPMDGSNAGYMVRGVLTMSSSYATGGDTMTPASVGLGIITKLDIASGEPTALTTSYLLSAVQTSGPTVAKVQAFVTGSASGVAFSEVTNATNLATVAAPFIAFGT